MMDCTRKGDTVEEKRICASAVVYSATEYVHWYLVPWYVCSGIQCHGMCAPVSSAIHLKCCRVFGLVNNKLHTFQ